MDFTRQFNFSLLILVYNLSICDQQAEMPKSPSPKEVQSCKELTILESYRHCRKTSNVICLPDKKNKHYIVCIDETKVQHFDPNECPYLNNGNIDSRPCNGLGCPNETYELGDVLDYPACYESYGPTSVPPDTSYTTTKPCTCIENTGPTLVPPDNKNTTAEPGSGWGWKDAVILLLALAVVVLVGLIVHVYKHKRKRSKSSNKEDEDESRRGESEGEPDAASSLLEIGEVNVENNSNGNASRETRAASSLLEIREVNVENNSNGNASRETRGEKEKTGEVKISMVIETDEDNADSEIQPSEPSDQDNAGDNVTRY